MSTVLACALVFNLSVPLVPQGSIPDAFGFKQVELSKNVSQLLRSNADHIWSYNRDPRVLGDLVNYTDPYGTISGDPHLGNMSVIPVQTKSGQNVMRFLNVDFDDGGKGPFALEYARFVLVAKASSKDIRAKDLFNAILNYGYGVLYAQIEQAIILAGLDPYAGFLHADRPGKPSLVLDLIEEFRQCRHLVERPMLGARIVRLAPAPCIDVGAIPLFQAIQRYIE